MKSADYIRLLVSIVGVQAAGLVGAIFTTPAIPTWYQTLAKPELAPANWVFAPVWTTLFLLMGIAVFLIWQKGLERQGVKMALTIFATQLVFNVLWSVAFFGLRSPALALVDIGLLWLAIGATIVLFWRISRVAAYLLLPYIAWVSFAAYLNYAIFALNK